MAIYISTKKLLSTSLDKNKYLYVLSCHTRMVTADNNMLQVLNLCRHFEGFIFIQQTTGNTWMASAQDQQHREGGESEDII